MVRPFITNLSLRNYKSVASCQVKLSKLVFLVGPNGSGKSNVLDSLRFVSEALKTSLDHALRERGGIKEVRRRSGGHPNHFSIRLDFQLPNDTNGHYSFSIKSKPRGAFEVQNEECQVFNPATGNGEYFYHVKSGEIISQSFAQGPAAISDRLYLVAASGLPEFRPVFDALSRIEIYNLIPRVIGDMQKPDAGDLLRRDGSNIASVFGQLPATARQRVNEYLPRIVQGMTEAEKKTLGSLETIEFRQNIQGQAYPWRFLASSMSDGTLRAFGILNAVFQSLKGNLLQPLLVGLEEPETALHPAATAILLSALREASHHSQILVTSHSPELLDSESVSADSLLAVTNIGGATKIASIDSAGRNMLKDHLFTAGELLRVNQLAPDPAEIRDDLDERQMKFFEKDGK